MSIKINPHIDSKTKKIHSLDYYLSGLERGDRFILSECITFIESDNPQKRLLGLDILNSTYNPDSNTIRIGISGSPGVGKSTFIDYLAEFLILKNHKVAILAIDPTSHTSKGSILGDKTRMEKIGNHESIYIRPSSAKFELGGISISTKESIHLCESAGYDIVIVETVGVGQSETAVSNITDVFCLLVLPGAGDELQGIKRGITEMADLVVVNKADGEREKLAQISRKQYANSLHLMRPKTSFWSAKVHKASSIEKTGVKEIWDSIEAFIQQGKEKKHFQKNRQEQDLIWFSNKFKNMALEYFLKKEDGLKDLSVYEEKITSGENNPFDLIKRLIEEVFIRS